MKMEEVEVIDISPFTKPSNYDEASRTKVLMAWDNAFCELGFTVIKGHGVQLQEIESIHIDARDFFAQEKDVKMKCCRNAGYGNGGYLPKGMISVARSRHPKDTSPSDYIENIEFFVGGEGRKI